MNSPISYLKTEIVSFNTELSTLSTSINKACGSSIIKNILKKKALAALESGALESILFNKFEALVEEQAEGKGTSAASSPSFPSPSSPILSPILSAPSTVYRYEKEFDPSIAPSAPCSDPFSSIESSSYISSSTIIIDKEEFVEEVATIYKDELLSDKTISLAQPAVAFNSKGESFALNIILNEKQLAAKEMALSGKSYVLIGAAGTGKTTTQRSVAETLLEDARLSTSVFKTYDRDGERVYVSAPSIAFVAYTRRAASNLRRAIHKNPKLEEALKHNVMTIHALLEYEPETYWDAVEGKDKFRFAPKRTSSNPLTITHLVIEEASMVGAHDLWIKLFEALPPGVQIIFIGDINQLPPVFGPSVLNYALINLPIIELTEVYRNQGIVLENAHNILAGKSIVEDNNYRVVEPLGKDKKGNKVQVGQEKVAVMLRGFFEGLSSKIDADGEAEYDPEDCMILSPWNKQPLGTDNLNKHIAQFLGDKRKAIVHEVLAGMNKQYIALGDKVMFNKRDGIITKIERNTAYFGKEPQLPGSDLLRFGVRRLSTHKDELDDVMLDYSNFSLESLEEEQAERKQQASHCVTITYDDETYETISATGDFAPAVFSLGYVLTVHKAQGSEWRKVFIIMFKDQAVSLYRELFYTGATRARTKVTIIATRQVIEKAIFNQRIKGNTLADKLEYFNANYDLGTSVPLLPPPL